MSSVTFSDTPSTLLSSIKSGEFPKRSSSSSAASAIATSVTSGSASSSSSSAAVSAAAIPVISGSASSAVAAVSEPEEQIIQMRLMTKDGTIIYKGDWNNKTNTRHGQGQGLLSSGFYIGAWKNDYPNGRGTYLRKSIVTGNLITVCGIWKSTKTKTMVYEDGSNHWATTHKHVG